MQTINANQFLASTFRTLIEMGITRTQIQAVLDSLEDGRTHAPNPPTPEPIISERDLQLSARESTLDMTLTTILQSMDSTSLTRIVNRVQGLANYVPAYLSSSERASTIIENMRSSASLIDTRGMASLLIQLFPQARFVDDLRSKL